ncbi:hypothetical protein ACET3X_007224 [Alternaria dauci]|uniref:Uncharacterized protein n=1 Tax=Alternaria dauci TaxID=48095 RepID=A0ABR3UBD1_9PLEO
MKFVTSILLAFAVSAQASMCNNGWGLPPNTVCPESYPHSYCCHFSGDHAGFPHERTCAEPMRDGGYPRDRCLDGAYIRCC